MKSYKTKKSPLVYNVGKMERPELTEQKVNFAGKKSENKSFDIWVAHALNSFNDGVRLAWFIWRKEHW